MTSRRTIAVAGFACLALATACGGPAAPGASEVTPLRIEVLAGLSAASQAASTTFRVQAAKAAVEVVNRNGGVLGKPVELDVQDTANDPTTAVSKFNSALDRDDPPAVVVQGDGSSVTAAVLPLANQRRIVSFSGAQSPGSDDPAKFPYNFELAPTTSSLAAAFCAQMKAMNAQSFGLIYNDTPFATSETAEVGRQCQTAGLTLVGSEKFASSQLDLTAQLSALKDKAPDVLMASTYGAPSGYLLQGLSRIGWNVPVLGDTAVVSSPVVTSPPPSGLLGTGLEDQLKGLVYASAAYSPTQPEALTRMISEIKTLGPVEVPLTNSYTYDAVILAAAAAQAAGTTTDAAAISKAVEQLPPGGPRTGMFAQYRYTPESHGNAPDPSAFAFVRVTKLVDGQFGNANG
jgi:branched-chain amino acid transport system substrate-binding protein